MPNPLRDKKRKATPGGGEEATPVTMACAELETKNVRYKSTKKHSRPSSNGKQTSEQVSQQALLWCRTREYLKLTLMRPSPRR